MFGHMFRGAIDKLSDRFRRDLDNVASEHLSSCAS